jgi:N,N'-diacetyllegionaminate synthase
MSVEIIAEIGVNHNGDFGRAIPLIDAAMVAGANTVKFQIWNTERDRSPEWWSMLKPLELPRSAYIAFKETAEASGMRFLCTPDHIDDAKWLRSIGCDRIKVGSANITNEPFLRAVSRLGAELIISTGACTELEICKAIGWLPHPLDWEAITLMHCISAYPSPLAQMNMLAMHNAFGCPGSLRGYGCPVGFSDHTLTSTAGIMAVAFGATIIEKHLTFSREASGPDHEASLEPYQFCEFVRTIREAESAMGDGFKTIMPCEETNRLEYERFVLRSKGVKC